MIEGEVYCALCGTVTYYSSPSDRPGETRNDTNILGGGVRGLLWLKETSLLTENLTGVGIALVERATHQGDGCYSYNVEFMGGIRQYAYTYETDFPVAFPVHDVCIGLFQKMLGPQEFDLECVYKALKRFSSPSPSRCLALDYGGAERFMGKRWEVVRGEEHYLTRPSPTKKLIRWYNQLKDRSTPRNEETNPIGHPSSSRHDPFVKLPAELVRLIMEHMTMADFWQWRGASRRVACIPLGNSLWRTRLIRDMPWLFDVLLAEIPNKPVNWEEVYKMLHLAVFSRSRHTRQGLVNRKRIWQTCSSLVEAYQEEKAIQDKEREVMPETMIDAVVDTETKPNYRTCRELLFLRNFADLDFVHPKIVVDWTRDVVLKKIEVGNCGFVYKESMNLDLEDQVFFPADGWLAGISIRTIHDLDDDGMFLGEIVIAGIHFPFNIPPIGGHADFGDPVSDATHLLAPRPGHFIVGFKVYDDDEGKVVGIELIQQRLAKLGMPRRRIMHDMVSAGIWKAEDTKEKFWLGVDEW